MTSKKIHTTFQELRDDLDRRRRLRLPRAMYWVKNRLRWFHDLPSRVHNVYCRARYGIGPRDSWSLDKHVAQVIAIGTRDLADRNFSHPGEERGWTAQEWNLLLMEVSAAMFDYHNSYIDQDVEGAREQLRWFVDNFEQMWD